MEARAGIEPAHKGFADLSLTTWVPRLAGPNRSPPGERQQPAHGWEECIAERLMNGAGDRGRTGDIFLGKEALYH